MRLLLDNKSLFQRYCQLAIAVTTGLWLFLAIGRRSFVTNLDTAILLEDDDAVLSDEVSIPQLPFNEHGHSPSNQGIQSSGTNRFSYEEKDGPSYSQNTLSSYKTPPDDGSHITEEDVMKYIDSIWDLGNAQYWRAPCDSQFGFPKRYEILKERAEAHTTSKIKYLFALDLFQVTELLPRLMGTLVQVIKQLGPEKCALSIVEGRSTDGTFAILSALKLKLEDIGTTVYLIQSDVDPKKEGTDRIEGLSELRNLALAPLINDPDFDLFNSETLTVFVNDIAVCTEDVYELMFQHYDQSAHMTCAMDWTSGGHQFYDSWVSRSMSGDLFFEVPQDISFAFAENMFWDHAKTKEKFNDKQPFQVYSCWGGMVTLSSGPFLNGKIKFHRSKEGECYQPEPQGLAYDLWSQGYGRIATIPTVNVAYTSQELQRTKARRGYVHDSVDLDKPNGENSEKKSDKIEWQLEPPGQVKCMPGWGNIFWTNAPMLPGDPRRKAQREDQ